MDDLPEILDLSIVFTPPPPASPSEILAHVAVRCDALGLSHTGEIFADPLTKAERDDLHWYLEEYWQWPYLEFAERGRRVEALLDEAGKRFYHVLFGRHETQNIIQAWQQQASTQHQISIVSEIASILRLPWELLADPQGFLVLHTEHPISMVRRLPMRGEQTALAAPFQLPLRVLLITARPDGAGFVDPRNISRELVDELQGQTEAGTIELEFLRPPTFTALSNRLKNIDRPIHVLHFDGHGGLGGKKQQGVLLFEDKVGKPSAVEASDLAKVLKNSGVRLAVLTACQSAMGTKEDDAFSSVSTQLINNGVDAVIAMSSSILVTSAALYAGTFYHAIAEGQLASIAHEQARQALQKDPRRHIFSRRQDEEAVPVTLTDWWIPHFYQQRPLTLHATTAPLKRSQRQTNAPARFNDAMPPEPRYQFGGRARELLQTERHLLGKRLVVLSGFGGVGKTALVREVADWLTRTGMYTSACFVSFEHGGDAKMLLSTLGGFLGMNDASFDPQKPYTALAQIQPILQQRPTLVIADNLESLLPNGDAPLEPELRDQLWSTLRDLASAGAGVLLTSRSPLTTEALLAPSVKVALLPLRGLLPDDAYALASRLFTNLALDRARTPFPALRALLTDLAYQPLAIQLVLPALRDHALTEIQADFARLLPTFTDDATTGRHRSLLASLEYSLQRLVPEQRALLPRLACFASGASENDLLAITQIPAAIWPSLRAALLQAALLTREPVPGIRVPFLRFHPILTPFLRSRPEASDPALLARFIARVATRARYLYHQDTQHPQAVRALALRELPNWHHALTLLLASPQPASQETAVELAEILARFLDFFGRWRERATLLQQMGQALAAASPAPLTTATLATSDGLPYATYLHESTRGDEEYQRGQLAAATARFTRLLARITALSAGTPPGPGSHEHVLTLIRLARCQEAAGYAAEAERLLHQAREVSASLCQQQPENQSFLRLHSTVLTELADALRHRGRYPEARARYEEALALDQQTGDLRGQAVIQGQLGALALAQRDDTDARQHCLAAMAIFQQLEEPEGEAIAWHQLGRVAEQQTRWAEAERCYRHSLALNERMGHAAGAAMTCGQLGNLARRSGRVGEAERWYRRALAYGEQDQSGHPDAATFSNLAELLVDEMVAGRLPTTRLAEARLLAEQALERLESQDTAEIWTTLHVLAQIADLKQRPADARAYRHREHAAYASFPGHRLRFQQQLGQHITAIAVAAGGDADARQQIEEALPDLEQNGWHITAAVQRLWAGERDWETLTEELNREEALLLFLVLDTLATSEISRLTEEQTDTLDTLY